MAADSPGATAVRVGGEAAEVARAETQAVLALVHDDNRRARLADLVAALDEGELDEAEADALAELLELGLQAGRIRSLYGPEGEQAVLALYRRLPAGRELSRATSDRNAALEWLGGLVLERLTVNAVGPGEYGVTISAGDYELVVRHGKSGARLATIGA